MVRPFAGDERSMRNEANLTRSFPLAVTASGSITVPLLWAYADMMLKRVVILPRVALAASGSAFWALKLVYYDERGQLQVGIPFSQAEQTFSTSSRVLVVGAPKVLPVTGSIDAILIRGHSLGLKLTKTGSPANFEATVQVDATVGG